MQSRNSPFIFGPRYNILTESPMVTQNNIIADTNPSSEYLITQNGLRLITQSGENLIANL